jgi:hypothetical protein
VPGGGIDAKGRWQNMLPIRITAAEIISVQQRFSAMHMLPVELVINQL